MNTIKVEVPLGRLSLFESCNKPDLVRKYHNLHAAWQAPIILITLAIALGVLPIGALPDTIMYREVAGNTTITTTMYAPRVVNNMTSLDKTSNSSSLQMTPMLASESLCWVCESSAPLWKALDGMDSCAARFLQGCFALPW
jgi:hypothetical protein